jgi:Fe-S-cluster containining protein
MNFLRWDYNTKEVTRFRRTGQCKQCDQCCQKNIAFKTSHTDAEENGKDGGITTDDTGVWYEVESVAPRRFFGHFRITDRDDCCVALEENRCDSYNDRHNLCRDWPMGPELILPNCGYSFEEVEQWDLDDL